MTLHFQQQHDYITQKYGSADASASSAAVVTFKPGHVKTQGCTANQMKNPIWEIAKLKQKIDAKYGVAAD